MSYALITQSFENSQNSVFGRTLDADLSMKGWFAMVYFMVWYVWYILKNSGNDVLETRYYAWNVWRLYTLYIHIPISYAVSTLSHNLFPP
jgi:hypothetical protein